MSAFPSPEHHARHPYEDAALSVEARVADLTGRLTLEDKAGLLLHAHAFLSDPEKPDQYGRKNAGELIREGGITHFLAQGSPASGREFAEWTNAVQRIAGEHPLRIPVTISTDPRHSAVNNPLTSNASGAFSRWPDRTGIAAIRDDWAIDEYAATIRADYRAVGITVALDPQIDLATEYRWARINGTFGEDAELTSRLGSAFIRGLQGDRLGTTSVAAMAKHFPGGGPQKDGTDPHFSDGREQVYPGGRFEYHLQPFLAALEAGVSQMMPYYGMPVGTEWDEVGFAYNKGIITGLLRDRLGFEGIVCTDFGVITGYGEAFPAKAWGVESLSREERVVRLLEAGIDQFGGENDFELVRSVLRSGAVSAARLDSAVGRILREKFVLGLFDEHRLVDPARADLVIGDLSHRAAAARAQKESLTLLKNGQGHPLLPLARGTRVFAPGMDPRAFDGLAVLVDEPEQADVVVVRTSAPSYTDPARGFLGSMHKGSLEFAAEYVAEIEALATSAPVILDVYLERPGVLTPLVEPVTALFGSYGTDDRTFAEVLFGEGEPKGRLPFDLPRSLDAVAASREDVPFDTADPLFRFGDGLRYPDPDVTASA